MAAALGVKQFVDCSALIILHTRNGQGGLRLGPGAHAAISGASLTSDAEVSIRSLAGRHETAVPCECSAAARARLVGQTGDVVALQDVKPKNRAGSEIPELRSGNVYVGITLRVMFRHVELDGYCKVRCEVSQA